MLIQGRYFNDLATLPTLGKHGALLPVVNIKSLIIEPRIIFVAESTSLFLRLSRLLLLMLLLLLVHILTFDGGALHFGVRPVIVTSHCLLTLVFLFIVLAYLVWCLLLGCCSSFLSCMWIYISHNGFFWCLFHCWSTVPNTTVNFSKRCFKGLHLCWSELPDLLPNVGPNESIELTHTLISDVSHILKVVLDALEGESHRSLHERGLFHLELRKDTQEGLVPSLDVLVRLHRLLVFLPILRWVSRSIEHIEAGLQTEGLVLSHCNERVFS